MASKSHLIAAKLGLRSGPHSHYDSQDILRTRMLDMLQMWIDSGANATIEHLIDALKSPAVGLHTVASSLERLSHIK